MAASDEGKETGSTGDQEDRLEEIKKEEQEDASSYYTQGSEEKFDVKEEFDKPLTVVDERKEEMSLLKTVAFLGFGLAALAIVFILFFIRDLDSRVGGVDSAVIKLEESFAPLKEALEDKLNQVSEDITGLKNKMGDYEQMMAIMELKRALITINEMSINTTPEVKAKSDQVIASIELLLAEMGAAGERPAGILRVQEAPKAMEPPPVVAPPPVEAPAEVPAMEPAVEEPPVEEPAAEEPAVEAESAPADEEEPAEESAEEAGEEASEEGEEGEEEDEEEE